MKNKYKKITKECSFNPLYVTEVDLLHPVIIRQAFLNSLIDQERYNEYLNTTEGFKLSDSELSSILENLFGFCKGNYEEELIEGGQKTIIDGKTVFGVVRYMGVERMDKLWVESGMASLAVRETYKWGKEVIL